MARGVGAKGHVYLAKGEKYAPIVTSPTETPNPKRKKIF